MNDTASHGEAAERGPGVRIVCRDCRHYHITWDPRAPHGCRAMAFKSSKLPSLVVYESSGIECQLFESKQR